MDWLALWLSVELAGATILVLLPFGIWLARMLAFRGFAGRGFVEALVALPLVLPPTVVGFYLLVAFEVREDAASEGAEAAVATVDHSDIRGSEPHNRDPSGAASD